MYTPKWIAGKANVSSAPARRLDLAAQVLQSFVPRKIPAHGHDTPQAKLKMNYCFGCGKDNPEGLRLKFHLDETGRRFVARFRLPRRFTGPPAHAHGGVIAAILDEAMGKINKLRSVVAMTKEMRVEYVKPVPLHRSLIAEAWEISVHGRQHVNAAEIRNEHGEVLARSTGTFIVIDPEKMFAHYLRNADGA